MQRLQHEAVAAERDDGVGLLRLGVAIGLASRSRAACASGTSLATNAIFSKFRAMLCHQGSDRSPGAGVDPVTGEARSVAGKRQARSDLFDLSVRRPRRSGSAAPLVDQGLAACVNIFPGMTAIYVWEGKRQRESETAMIIKTRAGLASRSSPRRASCTPTATRPC